MHYDLVWFSFVLALPLALQIFELGQQQVGICGGDGVVGIRLVYFTPCFIQGLRSLYALLFGQTRNSFAYPLALLTDLRLSDLVIQHPLECDPVDATVDLFDLGPEWLCFCWSAWLIRIPNHFRFFLFQNLPSFTTHDLLPMQVVAET